MRKVIFSLLFLVLFSSRSVAMAALVDNGDTVTDTATGLMWQKATAPGAYTWQQALAYAETLTLAGYTDWRLPNRNELQSLVDYSRVNPSIDPLLAPHTVSSVYWSSTTYASPFLGYTSWAWNVSFDYGYINYGNKSYHYVRAVRAGQSGLLGYSVIAQQPMSGPPGTTFVEWGTGFTPNSTAILHFKKPDGTEYPTLPQPIDAIGHFEITYTAPWNKPSGTYTWWAIDGVTGAKSNEVSYVITPGVGSVVINAQPDAMNAAAPWILTDPNSHSQSGMGDQTLSNSPIGNYMIIWGDVPGWIKPSPATETQALTSGGTITFSGTYVQQTIPVIQVTQSILNFGYVAPGSSKDLTLEVKNIGGGILKGTVTACPPFSIVSEGNYSLGAGESQQIVVRYTAPLQEGAQTCSFVFSGGGGLTIQVKGTNKKAGLPWLLLLLGN